jgi:hypothetical protein
MLTELLRRYRLLLLAVLVIIGLAGVLLYVMSLQTLTVNYVNASTVEVYRSKSLEGDDNPKPVKTLEQSGQSIKLRRGTYTIHYVGSTGYDSKYVEVTLSKNREITIKPDFSEEKQAEIAAAELPAIVGVLSAKYPKTSLYAVKPGKILRDGEWYLASLQYQGPDQNNSDSLKAVFHRENGTWVLKTLPPSIVLTEFAFPDIPSAVLKEANDLP